MTDRELMQMALDALGGAAEFMTRKMQEDAWKIQDLLSERLSQPEPDAVLAEREACAKLCEEVMQRYKAGIELNPNLNKVGAMLTDLCALWIRKGGQK